MVTNAIGYLHFRRKRKMNEVKAAMTEKEFCARVNLSRVSAWRLRQAGKLPHCRINGKILYLDRHIEEFLVAHEVRPKGGAR
jgi:hypothetical protein